MRSDIFNMTCAMSRGDEEAFTCFYQAYSDRMFGYIFVLVRGNESIAHDVHQEALLRTIRYMKPFDDENRLWFWLVRLMKTSLIDFLRKNKEFSSLIELPAETDNANQAESDEKSNMSRMLWYLDEALGSLSKEDCLLLEAYYFEGKSQLALAEENKTTPKALGMKFMRIRERLKSFIVGRLNNERQ